MVNGKPTQDKHHSYESASGRLETYYPKAKQGKTSTEYVYDRRIKQIEKGFVPDFGDALHTRFECRVSDTAFYKLEGIHNRCSRVDISALDVEAFEGLDLLSRFFLRYSMNRNLDTALGEVQGEEVKYKDIYNKHIVNIWEPKRIWSYLPCCFKASGLFA